MKFKITDTYTYWWPVDVILPDPEKTGKTIKQSFEVQFEAIDADESEKILEEIAKLPLEEQKKRQHAELFRVTKNWRGVTDAKGEEEPFSEELLRKAMQRSWFSRALYKAYATSLVPDEARKGN